MGVRDPVLLLSVAFVIRTARRAAGDIGRRSCRHLPTWHMPPKSIRSARDQIEASGLSQHSTGQSRLKPDHNSAGTQKMESSLQNDPETHARTAAAKKTSNQGYHQWGCSGQLLSHGLQLWKFVPLNLRMHGQWWSRCLLTRRNQ
ncbi:hypothetical protein NDU88_001216 [Pleurodeles waltl]|uniref:Secreted protein n=1 Tax=Pleurodeles waltl TaxID=8319 RepID=A0AAV7MM25_PLEWA|nr:hypothetical protein NDU88_001216 [Pleurodeles waltl]